MELRLGISETAVPLSLSSSASAPDVAEVKDCIKFLLDSFYTLHNFLKLYPPAALLCHKRELHIRYAAAGALCNLLFLSSLVLVR